jgi:hypothetical protein
MQRKCPYCRKSNVRRSSIRTAELTARHIFLSPYRCRDCQERFWVISRNVYFLAGIIGVALAVGAGAWGLRSVLEGSRREPEHAAPVAQHFSDVAKAAESGDSGAEYEFAGLYSTGSGVAKSDAEARKWLERSALHGNVAAQYELGLSLRDGRGAIQDYARALNWLRMAAESGHPQAQFALGNMYRVGAGIPVDYVKSYVWLNLAAAQGVVEAAIVRDAVLSHLSPAEVVEAQAEARRLSEIRQPAATATTPP